MPSDSVMILCSARRMEAQILYVSKPTTTKPNGKSAGMLGTVIARQALIISKTRNYGWTIVSCGDAALNLLGLSPQVPAVWSYVSDGTYKTYAFDKIIIKFKRTANKDITGISYKTALVIQAIKALGNGNVNDKTVQRISKSLTGKEKSKMLTEAKYATAWITWTPAMDGFFFEKAY